MVQLENLPASGQPVGRLEDLPVLTRSACWTAEGWFCFRSGCGKLGIIFVTQVRLHVSQLNDHSASG